MALTVDVLKSLYNQVQVKIQYEQGFVNNASDNITKTVAGAKVEAYKDVASAIIALLQRSVPEPE